MNYKSKILSVFTAGAMLLSGMGISYAQTEVTASEYDVSDYAYVLNNTQFFDINGESTQIPSEISSVSVDITKICESESSATLVICAYSDNGKMAGLYVIEPDVLPGETVTERLNITPDEDITLGDIKGYVWDSLSGMTPLSNVVSVENPDEIDDPFPEIPKNEDENIITEFSDIPPDYYAAEAIKLVSVLEILCGYEDGTFIPDCYLTKAEAAKLVTDIAGQESSSPFMKTMNYFDDVGGNHWASGYINYCYAKGYTAPVDNYMYRPEDYINPYEFAKMLIGAAGHNEFAEYLGGWPAGYLDTAEKYGLFDNARLKEDTRLTRADAAQMLYNALYMPVAEVTRLGYTGDKLNAEITVMDGEGTKYLKTLLTETYDTYTIEGNIADSAKTDASLAWGELTVEFTKSEKYANADFYKENNYDEMSVLAHCGEILNCDNLMEKYATLTIKGDEKSGYEILTVITKSKSVTLERSLLNTEDYEDFDGNILTEPFSDGAESDRLYFYINDEKSKSTKYLLNQNSDRTSVSIYVNGVRLTDEYSSEEDVLNAISQYVIHNNYGTIQLIDNYKSDGYYDIIYVDYYATAMMNYVSSSTGKVYFEDCTTGSTYMILDENNEELKFDIYLDGQEISTTELLENDVLSVKFDVTVGINAKDSFNNSSFYEVYAERHTFNAQLTGFDRDNKEVKLDGVPYTTVNEYYSVFEDLSLGNYYFWNLDAFGRIYKYELDPSRDKYAVVDTFKYSLDSGTYKITMLTSDGTVKNYILSDNVSLRIDGDSISGNSSKKSQYISDMIYTQDGLKTDISQRVIYYKVSATTGLMTHIEFLPVMASSVRPDGDDNYYYDQFKDRNLSIGAVKINSTKTKFINVIDYAKTGNTSSMTYTTLSDLADGNEYGAYAYGSRFTDGTYPLVVMTHGVLNTPIPKPEEPEPDTSGYNENTRFAVAYDAPTETTADDGRTIYEIPAYYQSDNVILTAEASVSEDVLSLQKGDVFFFTKNSADCIDKLDIIFTMGGIPATYAGLLEKSLVTKNDVALLNKIIFYPDKSDCTGNFVTDWDDWMGNIQLIYGPVIDKGSDYMTIGKLYGNNCSGEMLYTNLYGAVSEAGGCYEINLPDDVNVYTYDYFIANKNLRFSIGSTGSIIPSLFSDYYLDDDGETIPWNKTYDEEYEEIDFSFSDNFPNLTYVNFAFALVVDGEAVDVFAFNALN